MALDPFQHRVQLFTGKGGVGKSSVVAAVALAAAEAGHRPLVVELGHRATMETLFEAPAIGYEPTPVGDGVAALNMELDEALTDYIAAQVRVRGVAKRVVANETLRRLGRSASRRASSASRSSRGAPAVPASPGGTRSSVIISRVVTRSPPSRLSRAEPEWIAGGFVGASF